MANLAKYLYRVLVGMVKCQLYCCGCFVQSANALPKYYGHSLYDLQLAKIFSKQHMSIKFLEL